MVISSTTRISAIIKANPKAIDVIASINKHFEKLKNPILRKILAPRVTVADAAKIGGCSVDVFFQKLIPLGFEIKTENAVESSKDNKLPDFLNDISDNNTTTLDVRPILASGTDPFNIIMNTISTMPPKNTLLIINTFEPIPLINILKKKGFEYHTIQKEATTVYTYLKNNSPINNTAKHSEPTPTTSTEDFDILLKRFEGKMTSIDVRNLEAPQPMITILQQLEQLLPDHALYVNHKKVPLFLLPELKSRSFRWQIREVDGENVKMLIFK